jgi:hypothetical protein
MSSNRTPQSPGDAEILPALIPSIDTAPARIGHMPEIVDALDPLHPENSFTETRRLRHDGWTPEKMRLFHERFAECGVVREACEAAGMSARAAYNLRDRDPLFAAGWEAAALKSRARLADEAFSRSMNGVVERIYRDGVVVAERHRYDNRLTMSVLARLDARVDRAEERGSPHLRLVEHWDDYLGALGEDRRDDGMALLAPPAAPAPAAPTSHADAEDRELYELHEEDPMDKDRHNIWDSEGEWWTNYPPPAGFDGDQQGVYGSYDYRRSLSPAEQEVVDAEEAEDIAEAVAQRDAWFGFEGGLAQKEV